MKSIYFNILGSKLGVLSSMRACMQAYIKLVIIKRKKRKKDKLKESYGYIEEAIIFASMAKGFEG